MSEVGGWLSAKYGITKAHAVHLAGGAAAVLNPGDMKIGYTPAVVDPATGTVTTPAARVSANGPGNEQNVALRGGYAFSPIEGLAFVVEPFLFLTRHKLAAADQKLGVDRKAFGVEAGATYTF